MIPFGKHAGQPLQLIPASYLRWFAANVKNAGPDLLDAVRAELQRRESDAAAVPDGAAPDVIFRAGHDLFRRIMGKLSGTADPAVVDGLARAWQCAMIAFDRLGKRQQQQATPPRRSIFEIVAAPPTVEGPPVRARRS